MSVGATISHVTSVKSAVALVVLTVSAKGIGDTLVAASHLSFGMVRCWAVVT